MSETKPTEIAAEQLTKVGGGSNFSCEDYVQILANMNESYEHLINFTSYVIERVANAVAASNQ